MLFHLGESAYRMARGEGSLFAPHHALITSNAISHQINGRNRAKSREASRFPPRCAFILAWLVPECSSSFRVSDSASYWAALCVARMAWSLILYRPSCAYALSLQRAPSAPRRRDTQHDTAHGARTAASHSLFWWSVSQWVPHWPSNVLLASYRMPPPSEHDKSSRVAWSIESFATFAWSVHTNVHRSLLAINHSDGKLEKFDKNSRYAFGGKLQFPCRMLFLSFVQTIPQDSQHALAVLRGEPVSGLTHWIYIAGICCCSLYFVFCKTWLLIWTSDFFCSGALE